MSFVIIAQIKRVTACSILLGLNKSKVGDDPIFTPTFELASALKTFDCQKVEIYYRVFNSINEIKNNINKDEEKFQRKLKKITGSAHISSGQRSTDLDDWSEHTVLINDRKNGSFDFNEILEKNEGKTLYFKIQQL